jgi:hypothetical protein
LDLKEKVPHLFGPSKSAKKRQLPLQMALAHILEVTGDDIPKIARSAWDDSNSFLHFDLETMLFAPS